MLRLRIVGPLVSTLCIWGVATPGQPAATVVGLSLERVGWLAGCFEMRAGDRVVEEQRMRVRGASMLGMARTTTSKGLMEYELTLIYEKAGKILFEARRSRA